MFVIVKPFFFFLQQKYNHAKISVDNRPVEVAARIEALEREMELLCITGVEDKLVQTLFTVLMVLLKTLLAYILKVLLEVGFDDIVSVDFKGFHSVGFGGRLFS
jgi:hypothetical protein